MANKTKKNVTSFISKSVAQKTEVSKYINNNVAFMDGWMEIGNNANVFVSLRFLQENYQCFSVWSKTEMTAFWDFNRKIHTTTWQKIYSQARKGSDKSGYAITNIPRSKYSSEEFLEKLDPNLNFFELRVNDKIRVHGFRDKAIFYLCWLDKNHDITE